MQISPFQFLFAGRVEARTDYAQTLVPQTLERLSRPRKSAPSSVAARVGFQGGGLLDKPCTLTGSQVLAGRASPQFQGGGLLDKPRLPTRVHVNRLSGPG